MGKYHIGCAAYVRVQLNANAGCAGTFHEDMGYCNAENAVKGLAIQLARQVSKHKKKKKPLIIIIMTIEIDNNNFYFIRLQ